MAAGAVAASAIRQVQHQRLRPHTVQRLCGVKGHLALCFICAIGFSGFMTQAERSRLLGMTYLPSKSLICSCPSVQGDS